MSVEFDFSTIPAEQLQKWEEEMKYMKNLTILRSNEGYFPTPERFSDANSVAATVFMNFLDTSEFMNVFVDYMRYKDKIKKKVSIEQLMKKKKYQTILKACEMFNICRSKFEFINSYANKISSQMHRSRMESEDDSEEECSNEMYVENVVNLLRSTFDTFFNEFSEIEQQLESEYGLKFSDNMKINFNDFPEFIKWLEYKDWC